MNNKPCCHILINRTTKIGFTAKFPGFNSCKHSKTGLVSIIFMCQMVANYEVHVRIQLHAPSLHLKYIIS